MRANQDYFLEGFLWKGQHICISTLPFHPKSQGHKKVVQPIRRRPVLLRLGDEVTGHGQMLDPLAELAVGDCFQERLELG